MVILRKEGQPKNITLVIFVMPLPIVTPVKLEQYVNVPNAASTTLLGIIAVFMPVLRNV
jgi:hypothetical protein